MPQNWWKELAVSWPDEGTETLARRSHWWHHRRGGGSAPGACLRRGLRSRADGRAHRRDRAGPSSGPLRRHPHPGVWSHRPDDCDHDCRDHPASGALRPVQRSGDGLHRGPDGRRLPGAVWPDEAGPIHHDDALHRDLRLYVGDRHHNCGAAAASSPGGEPGWANPHDPGKVALGGGPFQSHSAGGGIGQLCAGNALSQALEFPAASPPSSAGDSEWSLGAVVAKRRPAEVGRHAHRPT